MPPKKNINPKIDKSIEQIMKERFVHSLSHIIYDKVATLWHIDIESEKIMAQIASKVAVGIFCLEYLSHIHALIKEKSGIKGDVTASDLSDDDFIGAIKGKLSGNKESSAIFKNAVSILEKIVDSINIKTLEDLTKVAHTGDYLLSSLRDMKDSNHDEYNLWLSSVPYYYEKDLKYLNLVKTEVDLSMKMAQQLPFESSSMGFSPSFWNEQFPEGLLQMEKINSNHRINLNLNVSSPKGAENDGYFPCAGSTSKNKKRYSRIRS